MISPIKMSLMVFDDIFFIYNPINELIDSKSILELSQYLRDGRLIKNNGLNILMELSYVLIPEMMYQASENQLLINQKYPHLLPASHSILVDTWPLHFTKCIYYIPREFETRGNQVNHVYTAFSKYSEVFFDKYSQGLWTFKIQNKLVAFLRLNNSLKEVRSFEVRSPDETSFHLLKMLEPYKEHQQDMHLWTNENDPYFLQIISKYIPGIIVEKNDVKFLIKNILAASCASLQET